MMEEERPNDLKVRMQQKRQRRRNNIKGKSEGELKKDHDEIIDVILNKEEKVLVEHRTMIEKLVEIIKGDMQLIQKTESTGKLRTLLFYIFFQATHFQFI